jgi:hypothetical protein
MLVCPRIVVPDTSDVDALLSEPAPRREVGEFDEERLGLDPRAPMQITTEGVREIAAGGSIMAVGEQEPAAPLVRDRLVLRILILARELDGLVVMLERAPGLVPQRRELRVEERDLVPEVLRGAPDERLELRPQRLDGGRVLLPRRGIRGLAREPGAREGLQEQGVHRPVGAHNARGASRGDSVCLERGSVLVI